MGGINVYFSESVASNDHGLTHDWLMWTENLVKYAP